MKTKSIIAMSLMAALAAGCSSDDIVDDGGKKPGMTDGKAYVALNIMMPSTNGSRADEHFSAGVSGEYQVNDVTVTYFASADGKTPRFTRTYKAEELDITVTGTNDITSKVTLPVEVVPFSGNAYALVEINNPGITVSAANNKEVENITDVAYFTGESKNDFFMTNTVMKDGKYLAQVTTSNTAEEAKTNAANNAIYVERAVGKVNLCVATGTGWSNEAGKEKTYTIQSGVNANATVEISAWKLDITNKKMFPIRKFDTETYKATDYPRFYGNNQWRTYWAQDPNYSDYDPENKEKNFIFITEDNKITNAVGVWGSETILPDNEYCLENTFDVAHQKQNETTRVLVKAVYTPAKKISTGSDWFSLASSTEPYTEEEIKAMIQTALGTNDDVELNFTSAGAGKKETITTTSFTVGENTTTDEDVKKVVAAIGETISYYKNGVCYYPIRIKHFGDEVCPWGAPQYDQYVDNGEGMSQKYLGRYGVVRNNWYQIYITSVSQPGSPEIPEPTTDQDDVKDNYLDAQINILDWAVRYQGVEL